MSEQAGPDATIPAPVTAGPAGLPKLSGPPPPPTASPGKSVTARTPLQLAMARLRRDKVALAAGVLLILLILVAVCAPLIAKLVGHDPTTNYPDGIDASGLLPVPVTPGPGFLLGADQLGRDVFVRTLYGARISLLVGIVATAIALVVGTTVGLLAGFVGGKTDTVLSRIIDIFLSFPFLVTALTLVALNRDEFGQPRISPILLVMAVISLFTWTFFARLVRGQVLSMREREFVEAARSLGASNFRVMVVDLMPNLVAPLIVYATLQIPLNIVFEATLSYLGVGVRAPTASWGNMLFDAQASGYYQTQPGFLLGPGIALLLTVLAFNLLGDGLRDALDPRSSRTMAKD
ncbi:MAG: peptide/nickel transport system permease protein [Frankiaceae bacterium]|nr:peptide/nickel transport system permease protein [Frankiaceae bacterium]